MTTAGPGTAARRAHPPEPTPTAGTERAGRIAAWVVVFFAVVTAGQLAHELTSGELTRWVLAFGLGEFAACGLALLVAGIVGRRFGSAAGTAVGVVIWVGGLAFAVADTANRLTQATVTAPLLLVATVISALVYFRWPKAVSRSIAVLAAERGWWAGERVPDGLTLPGTPLPIPVSGVHTIRNVVRGDVGGRTYLAFEVRWLEWHWAFYRRRRLGVCLAAPLGARLPDLAVEPERWIAHFVTHVTGADIALESDEFNQRYVVRAADRRYAYALLPPRAIRALLDARPVALRVSGDTVFCWDEAGLSPGFVVRGFDVLAAFQATLPDYAPREWGDPPPPPSPRLLLAGRRGDGGQPARPLRVLGIGLALCAATFPTMLGVLVLERLTFTHTARATVLLTEGEGGGWFGGSVDPAVTVDFSLPDSPLGGAVIDTDGAGEVDAGDTIAVRYHPENYSYAYWPEHPWPARGGPLDIAVITALLAAGGAVLIGVDRRRAARTTRA